MNFRLIHSLTAALLVSMTAAAQVPDAAPERVPQLTLAAVPDLLRLHLPILQPDHGVLVESVVKGSATEKAGIRAGDVLLEAGGRLLRTGDSLGPMDPSSPIVVLRRGRTRILRPEDPQLDFFGALPSPFFGGFGPFDRPERVFPHQAASVSSSAISSGAGGRAVSISRAGDQISLEMSMPEVADGKIRLHGTALEIEQQLQASEWNEAVKRQVRAVLQRAR
jgi:hypothetical protein